MKQKLFYGWIIVAATVLLNSLGIGLFSSIISLFFKPMVDVHGFSQAQISGMSAFATIGGLLAAGAMGKAYQTGSTRKLVLIFGLLQALSFVILSRVDSLVLIYSVSAFMGFATLGATALSAPGLITKWFEEKRGLAMGISMAGAGIGPGFMAPVLTKVIESQGYRQGFVTLAAMIAVMIFIAFLLIKDKPEDKGVKAYGLNPGDKKEGNTENGKEETLQYTLKEATASKMFVPMFFWTIIAGFVVNGVLLQIPTFYAHMKVENFGIYVGAYAMLAGVCKILIGYLYDKIGPKKANFLFYGFMIIAFISLIGALSNSFFIYPWVLFAGLGMGVNIVAVPLLVSRVFGSKNYATIYPVFMLLLSVGGMLGAVGSGLIVDKWGFGILFTVAVAGGLVQLILAQLTIILKNRTVAAVAEPV